MHRPTPLAIAFELRPHTLNDAAHDPLVTGYLHVPAPYAASQIDVASIRLNGTVTVSGAPRIEDQGSTLRVTFARADVVATLAAGDSVPVVVTGTIAKRPFEGSDTVHFLARPIHTPTSGVVVSPGAIVDVTWDPAPVAATVTLRSSTDDGRTWRVEAEGLPNTGTARWIVPALVTAHARVEIVTVYSTDESGVVLESEFAVSGRFTVAAPTDVAPGAPEFALDAANPAHGALAIRYSLMGAAPATVAAYDVSGRLVFERRIEANGPRSHTLALGRLPPGSYVVRLGQGGLTRTRRVVVLH
jgi:hypothetical protein